MPTVPRLPILETMTTDSREEFDYGWLSRVPEYLGLLVLGVLVAVTSEGAELLPERIPTHFGVSGAADGWGPKYMLYVLVALVAVMYGGMTLIQRVPHRFNYPVRVTEQTRARLQRLGVGLVRWLKVEVTALFTYIQWSVVQVGTGRAAGMSPEVAFALVACVLATTVFFAVWMVRAR